MRFKVVWARMSAGGVGPSPWMGVRERACVDRVGLDLHVSVTGVSLGDISSRISCQRCTKSRHGAWVGCFRPVKLFLRKVLGGRRLCFEVTEKAEIFWILVQRQRHTRQDGPVLGNREQAATAGESCWGHT